MIEAQPCTASEMLAVLSARQLRDGQVSHWSDPYPTLEAELNERDRQWMPILHKFRDNIDLYTKRETPGRYQDYIPAIYDIVHRYIRPDYKLRW